DPTPRVLFQGETPPPSLQIEDRPFRTKVGETPGVAPAQSPLFFGFRNRDRLGLEVEFPCSGRLEVVSTQPAQDTLAQIKIESERHMLDDSATEHRANEGRRKMAYTGFSSHLERCPG